GYANEPACPACRGRAAGHPDPRAARPGGGPPGAGVVPGDELPEMPDLPGRLSAVASILPPSPLGGEGLGVRGGDFFPLTPNPSPPRGEGSKTEEHPLAEARTLPGCLDQRQEAAPMGIFSSLSCFALRQVLGDGSENVLSAV